MLDRPATLDADETRLTTWSLANANDFVDVFAPLHASLGVVEVAEADPEFRVDLSLSSLQGLVAVRFATRSRIRFRRQFLAENQIELHFVETGRHVVKIDGSRFDVPAGHAYVILKPGSLDVEIDASTSGTAVAFSRRWCAGFASYGSSDPGAALSSFEPVVRFDEGGVDALRHMVDLLTVGRGRHLFAESSPGGSVFKDAILTTFMSSWPRQAVQDELFLYPGSLKRALTWINQHLAQEFGIEEVADVAGTSVRTLQMYFRQYLRTPPRVYVTQLRLEKVRQDLLLARTTDKVSDIAARWGFSHMGHFASVYRDTYGETPSATRSKGVGVRNSTS